MRHVVVMTATGSIGLIAVFIVDALNLFYISLLGIEELAAAIGFAGTLLFFTVSLAIGLTIATSALVARALGRRDREEAARMGGASMLFVGLSTTALAAAAWPFISQLLGLIGATGATRELATRFLQIVLPSTPIIALGMCTTGIMRGAGDARRSMMVTLVGGIATAILDPILIFGFGLGLDGAAIATVLSRFLLLAVGLHGAIVVHKLVKLPTWQSLSASTRPFFAIGIPAVLTQVATPVGNTYVTVEIARFGDGAVAGWAIIGRLIPVAFGVIFALSGAVGPILGQNYGARRYDRLTDTLRDSLIFTVAYVIVVWLLLAIFAGQIASIFGTTGDARELVIFFCLFAAGSFLFNGALFVANAAFNNLGFPTYATVFNWGRSTLGVIPLVWVGAHYYGAKGVIAGWGLGAVIFGVAAAVVAFRVVAKIGDGKPPADLDVPAPPPSANSPFSTGKAATLS
ncbi:MATE family efflux transporter [Aquamicrobium sp. LC103]|nr:MATE family efflux transporter [Aquamicrobium sp. LC103]